MVSGKDILQRINSVKTTQQVTKAMKMVSAAKLMKTQRSALASRPYTGEMEHLVAELASGSQSLSPLLERRPVGRVAILLVTGSRGLAGGFHASLINSALAEASCYSDCEIEYIAVGKKCGDFLQRTGRTVAARFDDIGDLPDYSRTEALSQFVMDSFQSQRFDKVVLIYKSFLSAGRQQTAVDTLLPVPLPDGNDGQSVYLCEEGLDDLMSHLLPLYLKNRIFQAVLESKASEHVARMTAMSSASTNADDMLHRLALHYNRSRQAAITQEISEIVAGSGAI